MKPTQYLIRFLVFTIIILDPSDGGIGIALGVSVGLAIGFLSVGIQALRQKPDQEESIDEFD